MSEENALILKKLMALCSRGEKCEYDAYQYMTKRGASHEDAKLAVEYLVENRFIDNERYSTAFAADKLRFAKWGKNKIVNALRLKRIPDTLIQSALDMAIDPDDEKKAIESEVAKKLRGIRGEPRHKIWEKLMRFAISRGYPIATCKPIIDRLMDETND